MKRILALLTALVLLCGAVLVLQPQTAQAEQTATVKGGWLRLRTAPSFDASVLASYYTGTKVTILGTSGAWYHVRVISTGYEGYMYGYYLTISGSSSGYTAYVTSTNGLGVRLRQGPGTGYGVIGVYDVGTTVTVLSHGSTWSYIQIGSVKGYMMSQFLTTKQPSPEPSYGYTAYVTSTNGYGVRLRSGPSTGYGIIGYYAVGTQVTVLTYGSSWCYIQVGGRTGYMMTKFLTTTQPYGPEVTSVTLSTTSPQVGDVITPTVKPAGAEVSWKWEFSDGSASVYSESLYVTEDMLGVKIRLRVTGYGSTTGEAVSSWTAAVTGSAPSYILTKVTIKNGPPVVGETLTASLTPSGATADVAWYWGNGTLVGTGMTYTPTENDVGRYLYCIATGTGSTSGTAESGKTKKVAEAEEPEEPEELIELTGVKILNVPPVVGETLTASLSPSNATADVVWYWGNGTECGEGMTFTPTEADVGRVIYCVATGTGSTSG